MKNIILIGMPGCGKSTIGVVLAKTLGIGFVDTDLIIQQCENRLLQDIINRDGTEFFLDCEEKAVMTVNCSNSVIATGGSVIFRERAMNFLKNSGIVIYLNVPVSELNDRLSNIKTRGIAAKKGESITDIYKTRSPLYEKFADYTIDVNNMSVEQVIEEICSIIK